MNTVMMTPTIARMIRRVGPWLAVWAVTALVLITLWPVRPRLSLTIGADANVIGITPDSQDLVMATRRMDKERYVLNSAPLQVLSLQTGLMRQIKLPHQPPCDIRVTDNFGIEYLGLDEPWQLDVPRGPFHGRWLRCAWSKWDTAESRTTPNLLVHLDSGRTIEAPNKTRFDLSLTGRLRLESHSPTSKSRRLSLHDQTTDAELFKFNVAAIENGWAFSPDEQHFAYAAVTETESDLENRLWVWQIEPVRLLHLIDGFCTAPVFSPDGKLLAVVLLKDSEKSIVVFDVLTGARVWEQPLGSGFVGHFSAYGPRLAFSPDGEWLLTRDSEPNLQQLMSRDEFFRGSDILICDGWHLATQTHVVYSKKLMNPRSADVSQGHTTVPPIMIDDRTLRKVPENQVVMWMQDGESIHNSTSDGRILLVSNYYPTDTVMRRMLRNFGIPIPSFFSGMFDVNTEWHAKDVIRGQFVGRFHESCTDHWLSPDNCTLVVRGEFDPTRLNVYDFPPRPARAAPLLWALVVPLLGSGIAGWRKWRRRVYVGPPSLTGG